MSTTHWFKNRELETERHQMHLFMHEQLLQWQKKKFFFFALYCDCCWKWIQYKNLKHSKSYVKLEASTLSAKPKIHDSNLLLYIWWYQLGVLYYMLFKLNKTILGDCCWLQLIYFELSTEWEMTTVWDKHNKMILQHDKV